MDVYNVADGLDAFTLSVLSLFAGDETSITWFFFSKLYSNDIVYHHIPDYLIRRLQRGQFSSAYFVLNRYATMSDVLDLGWLLLSYNMELNLCKTVFKALNSEDWSPYLLLEVRAPKQNLRSSDELNHIVPKHSGPFQDSAARSFNNLLKTIKTCAERTNLVRKCEGRYVAFRKSIACDPLFNVSRHIFVCISTLVQIL